MVLNNNNTYIKGDHKVNNNLAQYLLTSVHINIEIYNP